MQTPQGGVTGGGASGDPSLRSGPCRARLDDETRRLRHDPFGDFDFRTVHEPNGTRCRQRKRRSIEHDDTLTVKR